MVRRVLYLSSWVLVLVGFRCTNTSSQKEILVNRTSSGFSERKDILYRNNAKFSGAVFELYPSTTDTASIMPYKEGRLDGFVQKWHPSGKIMEERHYSKGIKEGSQITYWENGKTKFSFVAKNDAYEGELKEWAASGKLIHLAHFKDGQENGVQKLWYDNGKIRANYVIINGKRYGLLGTKNCKNVADNRAIFK